MNKSKPMGLILIEDNEETCNMFQSYINSRTDVTLIAKTASSFDALTLVKTHIPEGVIVDLELHDGAGSGFYFLKKLIELDLPFKPITVVTTKIYSENVYDRLHEGFADFIFYKNQSDYSPKLVIDALLMFRKNTVNKSTGILAEIHEDEDKRISNLINNELDAIGISYKLKGREYIFEAIYYLLKQKNTNHEPFTQYLSSRYKLLTTSIAKAIQTAINETWRTTDPEELKSKYTAKVSYKTGVPSPTEFIYYCFQKLKDLV